MTMTLCQDVNLKCFWLALSSYPFTTTLGTSQLLEPDHVIPLDTWKLDAHFHARAVAHLVEGYEQNGVHGAGSLTAQHSINLAVLCGFLPKEFLLHAKIGELSNFYSYLAQKEGIVNHLKDTRQLLACLCKQPSVNSFIAENIVCEFGQSHVSQPPPPTRDVPNKPGQFQSPKSKKKMRKAID